MARRMQRVWVPTGPTTAPWGAACLWGRPYHLGGYATAALDGLATRFGPHVGTVKTAGASNPGNAATRAERFHENTESSVRRVTAYRCGPISIAS